MPSAKTTKINSHKAGIEQIIDAIPDAVMVVNADYEITLFNKSAETMFGIKKDVAIGSNAYDYLEIYSSNNKPISLDTFCFKKSTLKSTLEDVPLMTNGKKLRVNINTAILKVSETKEETLITITDITKIKELEQTKDEFLSVASHELRTPMTIIKSYLWMISTEKHGALSDKQKDYIKKAIISTERMIELINDILNISRIEQNALNVIINRVELVETVAELITDFKIKADEKGIKLNIVAEKEKQYAYVDTSKLREILVNLVGNSFKFTDQGEITIDIRSAGDYIKVSVIDTGRGIKQNELERLFHKFGRLDSSYQTVAESEGTGLGLYIVKLYVDAMGGKIGVFSEGVGKGSTFWFTLSKKRPVLKS